MWNELINELPYHKKIKILRIVKGISQQEAAKACCTTQKNWWSWEAGKSYPRKVSQRAIANLFGVHEEDIFEKSTTHHL